MSAFYVNEAVFDLPEDGRYIDRTVTYLAGSTLGGVDVVLLIERRPIASATSLAQAVRDHGLEAARRFIGYSVLGAHEIEVGAQSAVDVRARWRNDLGEPIYTRRVHVALRPTWLIFTCEAPFGERETGDQHLDHVLASMRFRD